MSPSPSAPTPPRGEYERRLEAATNALRELGVRDRWLSQARWVAFLGTVALLGLGAREIVSPVLVLVAALAFVAAVVLHGRTRRRRELMRRRVTHYEENLARLAEQWMEIGNTGERYRDPDHMYCDDLDVFGRGSLFQLLCRARTRVGEDRLAAWLKTGTEKPTVVARQASVTELSNNVGLREELALLDARVSEKFDHECLRRWAMEPGLPLPRSVRSVAVLLSVLAVAAMLGWGFFRTGPSPLVVVLLVEVPFLFLLRHRVLAVVRDMDEAEGSLEILSQVLTLIEKQQFDSDFLKGVQQRLRVEGQPPSRTVQQLATRVGYLNNSLRNQFFIPIAVVLCLPIHLAHAIEIWRATVGRHIGDWLDAVGDFEAVVSLSGLAFERPGYTMPVISDEPTVLRAVAIGHPLLPAGECVRNTVELSDQQRLLLISGSNMSGKSTLLRTIGTNTVLALAGAPVNAERLEVSVLRVATAMRVSDSLQEGKSLFFAVLGRLKRVVDLAREGAPLLFLLDEILQGTNSHDRRIGAEAVIRSLMSYQTIGMVTTHDLALTEIASMIPGAVNVHFADTLDNGRMTFDYQLRPGVVRKSNAIELMRLVGLDV